MTIALELESDPIPMCRMLLTQLLKLFYDDHEKGYSLVTGYVINTKRLLNQWQDNGFGEGADALEICDGFNTTVGSRELLIKDALDKAKEELYPDYEIKDTVTALHKVLEDIRNFRLPKDWKESPEYKNAWRFFSKVAVDLSSPII